MSSECLCPQCVCAVSRDCVCVCLQESMRCPPSVCVLRVSVLGVMTVCVCVYRSP